jgi:serine/threonine protein kinase
LAEARHCETCGRALDESAAGLCPSCLLRTALEHGRGQILVSQLPKLHYFGDYELLEEIARGGMGVVYRARQVSLDRIVAVKMMRPGLLATEAEIRRFHAEAKTAAGLQHPNIVAIHEVGEIDGLHYFSMDFVDGPSLAGLVRERALSPMEAAGHVKTLAETVHYAHSRGILHRDLKPSNILVDSAGRPRITDFGLARPLNTDSTATLHGTVIGTPAYMPPEQASGDQAAIGPASDVYSLGAILYELLTGLPPFRGATQLETVRMVLEQRPTAPRKLNTDVPPELETICLRCLEKHPAGRYVSGADLAGDLDRFLRGEKLGWWLSMRPIWRWAVTSLGTGLLVLIFSILSTQKPETSSRRESYTIEPAQLPPGATTGPASNPTTLMARIRNLPLSSSRPMVTYEPGSGKQYIFTFSYPLRQDFPKVAAVQIHFNGTRDRVPCECAIVVEPESRRVFLQSDLSGSMGAVSALENAVCAVDLTGIKIDARAGAPFQVRIPVTFKRGFDGPHQIQTGLTDQSGSVFYQVTQK